MKVLVIDNYDSFTYNLVHLFGEFTDDIKVYRNDKIKIDEIKSINPDKIVISPGPGRPSDAGISCEVVKHFGQDIPLLGVCLGHQSIGEVFGGKVVNAPELMHGKTSKVFHDGTGMFKNVENGFQAGRYHSLVLEPESLPEVLEVTCKTESGIIMGVKHKKYPVEGIQFHPESVLTPAGKLLIHNWLQGK